MKTRFLGMIALGLALPLAACGGESASASPASDGAQAAASEAPAPTGRVIEVKMVTDGAGSYFQPAQIDAKRGDVIRFTLESGIHNVSFAGDQNASAAGLPGPSAFLQLPGQTHDVPVTFPAGEYKFQCDPHVVLGMVGTIRVQ